MFLSGDYEFLCHMYGLSGASGKQQKIIVIDNQLSSYSPYWNFPEIFSRETLLPLVKT